MRTPKRSTICGECGHPWPGRPGFCSWCGARLAHPLDHTAVGVTRRDPATAPSRDTHRWLAAGLPVVILLVLTVLAAVGVGSQAANTADAPDLGRVGVITPGASSGPSIPPSPSGDPTGGRPRTGPEASSCGLRAATVGCVRWSRTALDADLFVIGDVVLAVDADGVVGVDIADGAALWFRGAADARVVAADAPVVVIETPAGVIGLDAGTGRERWRADGSAARSFAPTDTLVVSSPAADDGRVRLRTVGAATGATLQTGPWITASSRVVVNGPVVVALDEELRCMTVWDRSAPPGSGVWSDDQTAQGAWPVAVHGDTLLLYELWTRGAHSAGTRLRSLDRSTGAERWRAPADRIALHVGDGVVAVMSGEGVLGLDLATGRVRWQRPGLELLRPGLDDDRRVLLVGSGPRPEVELVTMADGAPTWRRRLDGAVYGAYVFGDVVALLTDEGLTIVGSGNGEPSGMVALPQIREVAVPPLVAAGPDWLARVDLAGSGP